MPITYSLDQEQGLILAKVTGELSISLTEDYFARLEQDKNCPKGAIEIVDFSGVTDFAIQYGELRKITEIYQNAKAARDIQATIFNCLPGLSYGIARMLKTLHELTNEQHTVIITRSQEELASCIEKLRSNQADADEL